MTVASEESDRRRGELRLAAVADAERKTIALCRASGLPEGYRWDAKSRRPPLPFWERKSEPGKCRVCGQAILVDGKPSKVTWHPDCTATYFLWMKPSDYLEPLIWRQNGLCVLTGEPIGPPARQYVVYAEADHEVPIFRIRREMADRPWFELLPFWGLANLRAITRAAHVGKSALEAKERAGWKAARGQETLPLISATGT